MKIKIIMVITFAEFVIVATTVAAEEPTPGHNTKIPEYIMTADKVTLRLNAVVAFRVVDAVRALDTVEDYSQALYRDSQLALRGVIGSRELDAFLSGKEQVEHELAGLIRERASAARLGVWLLFGLVGAMQVSFVLFFVYLWRRARKYRQTMP